MDNTKVTRKVLVGEIVRQFKNCACGEKKEGFCKKCKTEAKDIVAIKNIESEETLSESGLAQWLAGNNL